MSSSWRTAIAELSTIALISKPATVLLPI
ncbi:MAG: hypothetical protein QOG58_6237, partial [Caballeronia sp.]|nr:hypothetical protein [Caballeronia sp.]